MSYFHQRFHCSVVWSSSVAVAIGTHYVEVVCKTSGLRIKPFIFCGAVEEGLVATRDGSGGRRCVDSP